MAKTGHPNVVIDHAILWRGAPHRWSTVYNLSGTTPVSSDQYALMEELLAIENDILPPSVSENSGFLRARFYNGSGGAPTYTINFGVLETPSTWAPYASGTVPWTSVAEGLAPAEVCFNIKTPLTGLSSSGKPVHLEKYFHGVPAYDSSGELASGIQTAINSAVAPWASGLATGARVVISPSGRQSSSAPTVQPYCGNHQMPRGRKRKSVSSGLLKLLLNVQQERNAGNLVGELEDLSELFLS